VTQRSIDRDHGQQQDTLPGSRVAPHFRAALRQDQSVTNRTNEIVRRQQQKNVEAQQQDSRAFTSAHFRNHGKHAFHDRLPLGIRRF
jgi:hypothetical protein